MISNDEPGYHGLSFGNAHVSVVSLPLTLNLRCSLLLLHVYFCVVLWHYIIFLDDPTMGGYTQSRNTVVDAPATSTVRSPSLMAGTQAPFLYSPWTTDLLQYRREPILDGGAVMCRYMLF